MSCFLVTGATGFVGRHLCQALVGQGHSVRAAVRPVSPTSSPPLAGQVDTVEIGEVGPGTNWGEALEGVETVFHLAGVAHRLGPEARDASREMFRVNSEGTAKLAADMAAGDRPRRLVFLSSVGVMADASETVLTEGLQCHPASDYGRSKLRGEIGLRSELEGSVSDWCIVRAPLVYGPGNPGNMARLFSLLRLGVPLPLGSIANRRSLIYVGNLVDVLMRCATHPNASRQVFLVSDARDLSTPELIRAIAQSQSRRALLFPMPRGPLQLAGRIGDWASARLGLRLGLDTYSVDRLWGSLFIDSSKVRKALDWEPPWNVGAGLKETWK